MLRNITIIEVGDPKVKQDIEKKREVKNDEIETVIFYTYRILNCSVNTKNPERLDEKVQKEKQSQICQKFTLHGLLEKYPKDGEIGLFF